MNLKPGPGVQLGFAAEAGLTLRVCRVGREPLVAESGTQELWCDDYSGFSKIVPLAAEDLDQMQREASRGFLGDLAQGVRPIPRAAGDLPWYDRGFKEGWLPAHRIAVEEGEQAAIRGPWEQFVVVGVTPAYGDGHTPAIAQTVLQAKDRRTYLLLEDIDQEEVSGIPQSHGWWVNQVSSGAALPLEHPIPAKVAHQFLVLRGGEQVLPSHTYCYDGRQQVRSELQRQAEAAQKTAEAALRRGNSVVAELCIRKGLRAVPDHPGLTQLLDGLVEATAP